MTGTTAAAAGLACCHTCYGLVAADERRCPRCRTRVHLRLPNSLQRTMALVLTAALLYIPAMTLPIMTTVNLGEATDSTVVGGVVILWRMGSYAIAGVIFIASVCVPIGKLIVLSLLCWMARYGPAGYARQHTVLYRLTELVGRWSMIDVFVVAILVALIKLGDVLSFYPGLAALAFTVVVIVTMLAAETFDPRLLWDRVEVAGHD
jgi:paraquat-inducible protein A